MPRWRWNDLYSQVPYTPCRIIDIWGGRGRGGSHFATDYFLYKLIAPDYFRGYFVRRTFNDIRDSLWRDIKDRIEEHGLDLEDFSIVENEMRITYKENGNSIVSKGVVKEGSRTAKMKSLAGATDVLIEEADELEELDFDQLDLSLRTTKAAKVQIFRVFNPPPKKHWIWRDYTLTPSETYAGLLKATVKPDAGILSIFSTYHDNKKNLQPDTIERMLRHKDRIPDYYYTQVLGYVSEGAKGRIYHGWEQISAKDYGEIDAPEVYGLDFGFSSHPTALVACKAVNDHRYYRLLIYSPGLTTYALAMRMADLGITEKDIIICDTGGGGDRVISELSMGFTIPGYQLENGFSVYAASKGPGSVVHGINTLRALEIFVCEDSLAMWEEYLEYRWALDKNKEPTDNPVKVKDDAMDAARYIESVRGVVF